MKRQHRKQRGIKFACRLLAICLPCASGLTARGEDGRLQAARQLIDDTIAKGPFKAEWDSLKAHEDPEWFRDAKFGI